MWHVLLLALVALTATIASANELVGATQLGYGVHKLRNMGRRGVELMAATTCDNVTEHYFADAVIDNFAPIQYQEKWQGKGQRYYVNKQFWGGNNYPIFAFIGGEGEEKCTRLTNSMYLYELAREHQALLLNVEHRYYGASYPTDDSTKNLRFLSSQQALADLARVITHVKKSYHTENSKVLTVGGSYPGNLAAWFRLKYPSVTHASIASSAPVIAHTNFNEYMEVVGQALIHFSGQKCYNAMEAAAEKVAELAKQGPGSQGFAQLEKDFVTCKPMANERDLAIFMSDLMGNVQGTIQYNNEKTTVMNANQICDIMLADEDPYTAFVNLQAAYRQENGQDCEDGNWEDTVAYMHESGVARSWTYQTCNEFGYYQTTDSPNQPFHSWKWVDMKLSRELCAAAFGGWHVDPQVDFINTVYGGVEIDATNVVYSSGTIDPWHYLGISNTTLPLANEQQHSVFIEGTAHCHDLYAPKSTDPASLVYAREQIAGYVRKWFA